MSEQVAYGAKDQNNSIFLDGIEYPVHGPIRGTSISEFSTGLKIGKATYDTREHAFWTVLDDFSGGFGHRILDVREAGGTHWDNDGGVDTRRPKHVTLPPKRMTVDPDNDPGASAYPPEMITGTVSTLHVAAGQEYQGAGDTIYRMKQETSTGMRTAPGRLQIMANTNRITKIVEFVGSDGIKALYACGLSSGSENNEYYRNKSTSDETDWTIANAIAGQSGAIYFTDFIVYNRQLIGQTTQNRIISSADGANWSIDATPAEDPIYRASGVIRFLGIAMAPWGEPAIYFLDAGRLYVLDFQVRTAYEIQDLGKDQRLTAGVVWGGSIIVTNSTGIFEYNPGARETVRFIGPFSKLGSPDSWASQSGYHVSHFLPGDETLYAVFRSASTTSYRLAGYNGAGWSWLSADIPSSFPISALLNLLPARLTGGATSRYIDILAATTTTGTDLSMHSFKLPRTDVPNSGSNTASINWITFYENGPKSFQTGWYDGGFSEIEGALFRLELDGFKLTGTETVKVGYRLNNDENASFTTLGTFIANQAVAWFDEKHIGVPFKTVQLEITLNRRTASNENPTSAQIDSDNQIARDMAFTPELKALILWFDKKPLVRTAWTARVDASKMVAKGMDIDGETVTSVEDVWQKLKSLRNQPQLIQMHIPSLEGNVNVRIADMPGTFTGWRDGDFGRGFVDLQLLEPVA